MSVSFNAQSFTVDVSKTDNLIETLRKKYKLPGVQVTVKDLDSGKSWNFVRGYSNRKTLKPLDKNTLMQIGSTTKSFTASLVLLTEAESEAGRLGKTFNIHQTVGDWLPEYPEWKHITIRQLLNMTSGIFNYTDSDPLIKKIATKPGKIWQKTELVDVARAHKPVVLFPAGTDFNYSNTNYILAEMILERVTGQSFEALMEGLFKKYPDYFKHTYYSPVKIPAGMAHGYYTNTEYAFLTNKDITAINMSWGRAAGAILSTSADLTNWAGLILSDKFLPVKQQHEMKTLVCIEKACKPGSTLKPRSKFLGYGLGIAKSRDKKYGDIWQHSGGTLGFHAFFIYVPEKKLAISVITNLNGPDKTNQMDAVEITYAVRDLLTF